MMVIRRRGGLSLAPIFLFCGLLLAAFAVAAHVAKAQLSPASSLTGEQLTAASGLSGQVGTIDIQGDCNPVSGRPTISYTASGPAVGPYPGTYRETGTATLAHVTPVNIGAPIVAFEAEFTIDSPLGRVMGSKQLDPAEYSAGICNLDTSLGFGVPIHEFNLGAVYTAVVSTPTMKCMTGGLAKHVDVAEQDAPEHPNVDFHRFDEWFTSGTPPVCTPSRPTSTEQCKNDGWRDFDNPPFKNQGQCIASVNHNEGNGRDAGTEADRRS
jgi:hypothetical protein